MSIAAISITLINFYLYEEGEYVLEDVLVEALFLEMLENPWVMFPPLFSTKPAVGYDVKLVSSFIAFFQCSCKFETEGNETVCV